MADRLGPLPLFGAAAGTWALLVELIQAAEQATGLFQKTNLTGPAIRNFSNTIKPVGCGAVDSPDGPVFHQYQVNERGIVEAIRVLDPTVLNNAIRCRLVDSIVSGATEDGLGRYAVKERVERCLLPF